ncbi:C1 family peptidase [Bdellovibrionota bacterium FG-1]
MLKPFPLIGLLCTYALVLTACENLPPGAYSLATDPLPARAHSVDATAYSNLRKTGRFYSISYQSIGRHSNNNPGHWVQLNDGRATWVITQGFEGNTATLRSARENYPKRENQAEIYRMLYAGLSESTRQSLELPDPDQLLEDDQTYSSQEIERLNDRAAQEINHAPASLPHSVSQTTAPLCTIADEGASTSGSDYSGNNDSDPACRPQADGIYAHYDWASKPYLTCVKDQGKRGTCVAFSIASAIEALVSRNQGRHVNLSEQSLYQRGRMVGIRDDFADWLTDPFVLGALVNEHWKIPAETFWEYNPSYFRKINASTHRYTQSCDGYDRAEDCSDSSHQMQVYCNDQGKYRYCGFLAKELSQTGYGLTGASQLWNLLDSAGSLNRLTAALKIGQPVILNFNITPSWDAISRLGFITYNGPSETSRGGHTVHVVGAIDNTTLAQVLPSAPLGSGGGYVIIKNSWGNCFGDGGFAYAPYDFIKVYTMSALAVVQ